MTLLLAGEAEYRSYFRSNFTLAPLDFQTSLGRIPIYFKADNFDHAFFESSHRDGSKDSFSLTRAERMDDIAPVLADQSFPRRAGWIKKTRSYSHERCVSIAMNDFVVVVRLGRTQVGHLKGRFITCYVADNSIEKILKSPEWNEALCIQSLSSKK